MMDQTSAQVLPPQVLTIPCEFSIEVVIWLIIYQVGTINFKIYYYQETGRRIHNYYVK